MASSLPKSIQDMFKNRIAEDKDRAVQTVSNTEPEKRSLELDDDNSGNKNKEEQESKKARINLDNSDDDMDIIATISPLKSRR